MPLYRTVSDRGLWKKKQTKEDPAPQHFHKPNYIDKSRPQITYSQLNLGQGYRYNSKQSIPDINKDIDDANRRFDEAYNDGFVRRASRAKSCPNTPRAVTPTSTLSRAARNPSGADPSTYKDYQGPQGAPPAHYTYTTPYISNGVFTPSPQYRGDYTEDDRYSFESRSLTAYSNYSERESTVDSSYRYPYAREPVLPEQPNPSRQAEDVVQMFLQKSFFPNSINNNSDKPAIGRIEDYSATTSPSTSTLSPPSSSQSEGAQQRASSRAAIAELRKSFLEASPPEKQLEKPKPNKYLAGSARRGPAPATPTRAPTTVVTSTVQLDSTTDAAADIRGSELSATNLPASTSASSPNTGQADSEGNQLAKTVLSTPLSPSRKAPPPPRRESSQRKEESSKSDQPTETEGEVAISAELKLNEPSVEKVTLEQLLKLPPVWQPNQERPEKTDQTIKSELIPTVNPQDKQGSSSEGEAHLEQPDIVQPILEKASAKEADILQPDVQQPSAEQLVLEQLLKQPPVWQPKEQMESSEHLMSSSKLNSDPLPSLHHAESASVRAEETTDSSSEEEVDSSSAGRRISVTINPMSEPGPPLSVVSSTPRLEAPPSHPHPWGPSPRLRQEASCLPQPTNAQASSHEAFSHSASSFIQPSPQQRQTPEQEPEVKMLPERSFQDPAFTTFHEEKDNERQKQKKKGFFSFFKKINKKKQPYGDDFIHIERRLDVDDDMVDSEEGTTDLEGDQSPRFHILQPDQPIVPMPGSSAASRRLFALDQQQSESLVQQQQTDQRLQEEEAERYRQLQQADILPHQHPDHFVFQQEQQGHWTQQQNSIEDGHLHLNQTSTQQLVQPQTGHLVYQDDHRHDQQEETQNLQQFSEETNPEQEDSVELFTEEDEVGPLPQNLQRRPSASRPTDIDDLILKHNTKMNSYSGLTHLDLDLEPAGGKETNVDDLWDDRDQFQVRAVQMAYVPPHERTQEIDIDAMLDYSDSQEETDEAGAELEEEHKDSETGQSVQVEEVWKAEEEAIGTNMMNDEQSAGGSLNNDNYCPADPSFVQEEVKDESQTGQEQLDEEQRRLEEERNYLELQNLALQQQLEAGEELLAVEAREGSEGSEGASSVIVKEGADLNYSLLAKQEAEWRAVARRDGRIRPRSAAEDRRAGESFFNFRSFRKPKNKNKVPNQPASLEDSAMSSSSDDRKEEKSKRGLGGVFNMQKAKKRPASYHPKGNQERVPEQNRFSLKDSPRSTTDESNEEVEQQEEAVGEPAEQILEDDLAFQMVREIQKSTTELNVKSRSLPKLGKGSEKSVFGAAALRFSMKKSKKRNVEELGDQVEETNGHNHDAEAVNNQDVEREKSDPTQTEENADESSEIVLTEANPHETSAAKKRGEKKPGFGDLFRSRSGKLGASDQIEGDRLEESSEHVLHTGDPRERSLSMRSSRDKGGGAGGLGEMFRSKSGKVGELESDQKDHQDNDTIVNGEGSHPIKSKGEKRGGGIGDMFRARSNSRGRTRKKDTEEGEEGTGQEESEQRKSPGIFGSLRRGKSRSRAAQPPQAVEVTGTNLEKDKKEEHPDGQEQDEQTGKESPLRESQVEEVVAKGRKSPGGGLGSLFFGKSRDRAPPLPSHPPPATPTETTSTFLRSATTQKSVRRPNVRQPPALRPLDRPPPPPQATLHDLETSPFQEVSPPITSNPLHDIPTQMPLDFSIQEGDQNLSREMITNPIDPALRQPSSLPTQPSLQLREPSPLPREPSPLQREDPSPVPTSEQPQQRLQDPQDTSGVGKSRQKGRQSGRFRKSATTSSLAATPARENPVQSRLLNTLVRPEEAAMGKNSATVGRTESYRRARGEAPPKRGDSLPRRGRPTLPRATSEDSVREAIARQEANRAKEKNDCSIM